MNNPLKNITVSRLLNILQVINLISILLFVAGILLLIFSMNYEPPRIFEAKNYVKAVTKADSLFSPLEDSVVVDSVILSLVDNSNLNSVFGYGFPKFESAGSNYSNRIHTVHITKTQADGIEKLEMEVYDSALIIKIERLTSRDFINVYPSTDFTHIDYELSDTLGSVSVWLLGSVLIAVICFPIIGILRQREKIKSDAAKIEKAREVMVTNPNKVMPSWDMAQLTLEQYFKRNLYQINMIFVVSVFVMLAGFLLISYGVWTAFKSNADKTLITIVSTASGILTEFIGATFIFIYNSTIKQAINYTNSLEKINSVGMSIKILDNIEAPGNNLDKLNDAKIEIAKLLIHQSSSLPQSEN